MSKKKSNLRELEVEESKSMNSINFESINSYDYKYMQESSDEFDELESTLILHEEHSDYNQYY